MRTIIVAVAALLLTSSAVPLAAAEMTPAQKDECVLASRNCAAAVDDIQTKIKRIAYEINKGTAVYTPEELRKLEQKLADVQALLHDMEKR